MPVGEVTKEQRQTGKTAELALGFGGGVDALAKMAINYHIDMSLAWEPLWAAASPEERELADERFADVFAKGNNDWLSRKAWQACWLTVRAWRRANKPIVDMWDQFHSASWHTLDFSKEGVHCGSGRVRTRRWLSVADVAVWPPPCVSDTSEGEPRGAVV